ncbi:MAG: biopolymer transporter ExbD [Muribaculaceae bacterium]|nr:biopolymer transporter ExbD [Muribaculaceae bacterium]
MAQIEQSDKGGKKKKGAQKKMSIHVDFTPMVDMNMLLITFFMLCTTMIKSQTVQIILPAKPNEKHEKVTQVNKDLVMTLILDTEYDENGKPKTDPETGHTLHTIYYYEGVPDSVNANIGNKQVYKGAVAMETYKANADGKPQGIRSILRRRNEMVMDKYDALKERYANKEIKEDEFNAQALEIAKDTLNLPATIILKAGPNTTYENVINAFDELQLNQIRKYSFEHLDATDTLLLRNYEKANGVQVIRDNVRKNS